MPRSPDPVAARAWSVVAAAKLLLRTVAPAAMVLAIAVPVSAQDSAEDATPELTRQQRAEEELRNLMNLLALPIVVAAKREQKVFDSILSASVITREEIRDSGAVSVADVIRLLPGVLVRETTPGNASVHVRGFDAVPPRGGAGVDRLGTGRALLMIDGRIAYIDAASTMPFGIMPVAVEDIERVEVIRGPATAMHGPNAVTGVVHIVTRSPATEDGVRVRGSMRAGIAPSRDNGPFSGATGTAMASWQRRPWRVEAVAYHKLHKRHATYYRGTDGVNYQDPNSLPTSYGVPPILVYGRSGERIYPRPDLALEQWGARLGVAYRPTQETSVDLHAGTATSWAHDFSIAQPTLTPLSFMNVRWNDAALRARVRGWDLHVAVFQATIDTSIGDLGIGDELATTTTVEKDIRFGTTVVRPGAQIRYLNNENPLIGGTREWLLSSGFVRVESALAQVAFMAALRAEHLDVLGRWYVPFEMGASWRPVEGHLLRLVMGRAYQAAALLNTSADYRMFNVAFRGRTDTPLNRSRSLELGYRADLGKRLSLDVETHVAWLDDIAIFRGRSDAQGVRVLTPAVTDLKLQQLGITGSAQASLGPVTLRLFVTVQRTDAQRETQRAAEHRVLPELLGRARGMPTVFGGTVASWQPVQNLRLNATMHYAGKQRHTMVGTPDVGRWPTVDCVLGARLLVHATAEYALSDDWTIRLSYRNILDQQAREFPFADRIRSTVVLGLEWDAHM